MKNIVFALLFAACLALAPGFNGTAMVQEGHDHGQSKNGDFKGKGDGVETCPVNGEKIIMKNIKGEFFGRTVYFCCAGCLAEVQKNPALYLKPTLEEQKAAVKQANAPQEFLGKGDGKETCPVMGSPVNKEIKFEWKGETYHVCCESCLETLKKNPALYLKPPKSESHDDHGTPADGKYIGKGDGIETCPVTGEPVNKEVSAMINGRKVYACCPNCLESIKKNPDAYLKK
ncbi:MAG: hypothetical protein IPM66_01150 [Acidobacteriota bacterium]|nr:MAG: hypothetical protein IPM66_01150 [Acidobacteriota bacterium]